MSQIKPVLLMILDGWGIGPKNKFNAITEANTPNLDYYSKHYPVTKLKCSGNFVGLPEGVMGNSEVGHTNIGAGRIVYQTLLRIDKSIEDKSFHKNQVFLSALHKVKEKKSSLHLMGLLSDGGVHSQISHLFALIDMSVTEGIENIFIHAIMDGRDTPPDSGVNYIKELQNYIKDKPCVKIATICGRFFSMDRDSRWDRISKAYNLYTQGTGSFEKLPLKYLENSYNNKIYDEFIQPAIFDEAGIIKDNDSVIFFNFRADRAREITSALTDNEFINFERNFKPVLSDFICMSLYEESFNLPVAFEPQHLSGILGEAISNSGIRQLRIAETEKYAHVTYFFNGGLEKNLLNEDRLLIPSPRDIKTYDMKPEMSAEKISSEVINQIKNQKYKFIVLNYANMDMVGHTGKFEAARSAVETVDKEVKKVVDAFIEYGGSVLITADHGNSETMISSNGKPHTAHTLNPVPLILIDNDYKNKILNEGCLADIAPTVLSIMGIEKPQEMTGKSLINDN